MAKRRTGSVQLIVRRGAIQRFQKLKKKTADLPVEVTWDRRKEERRGASESGAKEERRKGDRRQKPPFTWELSDFIVVEKTDRRQKK